MRIHTKTIIIIWSLFLIGCGTNKGESDDALISDTSDVTVTESESTENPCGKCGIPAGDACKSVGVTQCPEGWKDDGQCGCEPQISTCAKDEIPLVNGGCKRIGILPQDKCGAGWQKNTDSVCELIPEPACAEGETYLLGPGCIKLGPQDLCFNGKWGNVPSVVESGKIWYVWSGYLGNDSDGSESKPYKKIADAVNKAADGDTVILGACKEEGNCDAPFVQEYDEGVYINKGINLIGRCNSMVKIKGGNISEMGGVYGIALYKADNAKISGITITTGGGGIYVLYGKGINISDVNIFKNMGDGIYVSGSENCIVEKSIVDKNSSDGIFLDSAINFALDSSIVRNTQPDAQNKYGRGMDIYDSGFVEVIKSLITENMEGGIVSFRSYVDIISSRVNNTKLNNQGELGRGIDNYDISTIHIISTIVENNIGTGTSGYESEDFLMDWSIIRFNGKGGFYTENANAKISRSIIEENRMWGVQVFDTTLIVESSIVRKSKSLEIPEIINGIDTYFGRGLEISENSKASIKNSLISDNSEFGIVGGMSGTTIALEDSIIRDTKQLNKPLIIQGENSFLGRGIHFEHGASVTLEECLVEQNTEIAIFVYDSNLRIDSSIVRNTSLNLDGKWGIGVVASQSPNMEIMRSIFSANHSAGVVVALGTVLVMDKSMVTDTQLDTIGISFLDLQYHLGRGIEISNKATVTVINCFIGGNMENGFVVGDAQLSLTDTTVAANGWHGIAVQNSPISITSSAIRDTFPPEKGFSLPVFSGGEEIETVVGRGVEIVGSPEAAINSSYITNNTEAGIIAENSVFTVKSTIVRNTIPNKNNFGGAGVFVRLGSQGIVCDNLIEGSHAVGLAFLGAEGLVQNNIIRSTEMANGYFVAGETVSPVEVGDGLIIAGSNSDVIGNTVTESKRYGVVFDNAKSTFANNTVMKNTYGLVTQNCADGSMVQENNTIKDNSVDFPSGMEVKYNNLYISTPGLSSSGK